MRPRGEAIANGGAGQETQTPPAIGDVMIARHSSTRASWRNRLRVLAAIALLVISAPCVLHGQAPRACQPNDSTASALRTLGVWMLTDTTARVRSFRAEYGIPAGASSDVVRVEDAAVCEAATVALEARGGLPQREALVVVRLGSIVPFYLVAKRTLTLIDTTYVLDAQFHVVTMF